MPNTNTLTVKDKVQEEHALRYSEEQLRTIIASSSDHVIQLDDKLKIQTINKPLSGLTSGEMVGTGFLDYVYPEAQRQRVKTILSEALETGEPVFYENDYLTPDGESLSFETRVAVVKNPISGQQKTLMLSCRNITDNKRSENENRKLEQQCIQMRKLEAIGSMASGIVHDFNNLLQPILAFSTMGLRKIFDPFFSTKPKSKGTGLGLSMVSNIVSRHQGKIEVSSTLGKGSEFTVFLPRTMTAVGKSCKKREKKILEGNEKILLVDDEDTIVALYVDVLQKQGYRMTGKTDSAKAWEAVKSYPGRFNMVITDMTMPGMTGYQLALKVLDIRPDMPIILLSGRHETINKKKVKAIGIKRILMKPIDQTKLLAAVRNILDEK